MPTTDWNERWARDLERFRERRRRGNPEGIDAYLGEIHRVLRPGGNATLQYADRTKPYFQKRETWDGFSDMNGPRMERLLAARGFTVVEHDESLLKHSNVVVFQRP
jgi:hypothetical protein